MAPSRIASMMPRVSLMEIRLPVPFQPVFTRYAFAPAASIRLTSSSAYLVGWSSRNAWPKQAEKVGVGSVIPRSVPASFAVKPLGEVVLGLLTGEDVYRRKHAECVSAEEDNVLGSGTGRDRTNNVVDVLDGVGHTGVLCHALVGEIDGGVFTNGNVLEKSVALDGVVDIGFGFFVEVDNLCVAAAFKVEHAVVVPAVFVVTDKQTLGIG